MQQPAMGEDTCTQAVDTHLCAPWGTHMGPPLPYYAARRHQPTKWHAWPLRAHLLFGIITTILQFTSSYDKYFQCRNPIIRFCAWLRAAFIFWMLAARIYINTTPVCATSRVLAFTYTQQILVLLHALRCVTLFSWALGCFRFLRHTQTKESGLANEIKPLLCAETYTIFLTIGVHLILTGMVISMRLGSC